MKNPRASPNTLGSTTTTSGSDVGMMFMTLGVARIPVRDIPWTRPGPARVRAVIIVRKPRDGKLGFPDRRLRGSGHDEDRRRAIGAGSTFTWSSRSISTCCGRSCQERPGRAPTPSRVARSPRSERRGRTIADMGRPPRGGPVADGPPSHRWLTVRRRRSLPGCSMRSSSTSKTRTALGGIGRPGGGSRGRPGPGGSRGAFRTLFHRLQGFRPPPDHTVDGDARRLPAPGGVSKRVPSVSLPS